ncbi:RidA family protein [Pelagibacterium mangrovi]|uniref:RidA family protein n=1 Tax=Pelagibacterium mangrovi TaxID=3119828 RepID=UPI002FC59F06
MTVSEATKSAGESPYDRLAALGLKLPPPVPPIANFVNYVIDGGRLYLSGQGPTYPDGRKHTGKVGENVSAAEAYEHAKLTGLNLIAVMDDALGDLSRVRRIVKILGMVNATPDFAEHPQVINGCSDLFNAVFAEKGIHARSAIGFSSLPNAITVEIEAIVAIDN